MGVGGKFWDLLKPYVRNEGFDFLRNKRVAVDLSYWIVQHETAIKAGARNPHLRLTFFRTINLFSKVPYFTLFLFAHAHVSICMCVIFNVLPRISVWFVRIFFSSPIVPFII